MHVWRTAWLGHDSASVVQPAKTLVGMGITSSGVDILAMDDCCTEHVRLLLADGVYQTCSSHFTGMKVKAGQISMFVHRDLDTERQAR